MYDNHDVQYHGSISETIQHQKNELRENNGSFLSSTAMLDYRIWLKICKNMNISMGWTQLQRIRDGKWMNERGTSRRAYVPTDLEHLANVITHGLWVVPAIYAAFVLIWRSHSSSQFFVAFVYGTALSMLFIVSTIFHSVFYCNRNRHLKDVLHRCDRAMIYVFIAGSYFPWLSLGSPKPTYILFCLKWMVWFLAALGIIYQQIYHERYKCLETFFYVVMGLGPSIVILICGHEFIGMNELTIGGLLYLIGIGFFKADGAVPFAHAIWHIFVVMASAWHYYAILYYLYPMK